MAYEWKFNPRPYSDAEAKELLKDVVSVETTDWHYNTHHKGYVTFLNNIEKELEGADRSKANGNYSQIGELKRRFTSEMIRSTVARRVLGSARRRWGCVQGADAIEGSGGGVWLH